jgi:3-methyladenine DNA glycosylase AlkD
MNTEIKAARVDRLFYLVIKPMSPNKQTPAHVAAQIRRALKDGGSAERAHGAQRFFKEEIKAHGWRTADLRRAAARFRREVRKEHGLDFLVAVADQLFSGSVLEEKIAAVFLLEKLDAEFGDREFEVLESWLDRVSNWSDHDSLVHDLIGPMVAARPARAKVVFRWAKSPNRWRRRAACVSLIRGARAKMFFPEITKLSNSLLADQDDMVRKGLGWLLRETAKYDPKRTIPYLMEIRERASRLVLRTACETLAPKEKRRVLS